MDKHVVLGAGGAVGRQVIAELEARGLPVVAVERRARQWGSAESVAGDVLDLESLRRALAGATHVHVCIALPYSAAAWSRDWPVAIENIVTAAGEKGAVVAFLDNVYMYGPRALSVPFNEDEPQRPAGPKSRARKLVADRLLEAHAAGRVRAVIGRAADFYGPAARLSLLYPVVLERMLRGKAPQWVGRRGVVHTWAYTGDLARGLIDLALAPDTHGEAWHLPVGPAEDIAQMTQHLNSILGTSFAVTYLPKPLLPALSLFIPQLREVLEMLPQQDADYVMDWSRFQTRFPGFEITTYDRGLRAMVESFSSQPPD